MTSVLYKRTKHSLTLYLFKIQLLHVQTVMMGGCSFSSGGEENKFGDLAPSL